MAEDVGPPGGEAGVAAVMRRLAHLLGRLASALRSAVARLARPRAAPAGRRLRPAFPLWLKVAYTAFVALIVPVYATVYGPANFLWFSDVALLATVPALWREDRLLASTMAVGTLAFELVWNFDFFARLLTGTDPIGIAGYMFDPTIDPFVRSLSLFHVVLPALLLLLIRRLGYDRRALPLQTGLAWIILPASYAISDREANINWVYGPGGVQSWMPETAYLVALMVGFPLLVYLPTHLVLARLFGAVTEQGSGHRGPGTTSSITVA